MIDKFIIEPEITPTRQKILEKAIDLFARKGYTETSIRELAAVVGIKEASIYNHFPSKNAILEYILEEYTQFISAPFNENVLSTLKENPTSEGIISCMTMIFPKGKEEYYLKELYVILQEQHRNSIVRNYVTEHFILGNERVIKTIINKLKEYEILKPEIDPDFWAKMHSSLLYTFASRHMMGIGDNTQEFKGASMGDLMKSLYDMMLRLYGTKYS